MKEHLIDTHLLVPVKVIRKGQGQITRSHSQKMANSGTLMFHNHILFSFCAVFLPVQRQVLSFEQYLTLSQMTNFRRFHTERVCRRQFQI